MARPVESARAEALELPAAILIVDDTPAKRLAMQSILEPAGYVVVEAGSGEDALHAVRARSFAVILMDVQMPGMDGYETAKLIRLRRESEHTPIIFVTAHARDEAQVPLAYANGAVDFVFAPLVPEILRAKVAVFVELFLKSRELEHSLKEVTALGNQSRDNETRIRSVLENVADGIVTLSGAGLIESFNAAAVRLFGLSEEEAIGRPFASILGPDATVLFGRGTAPEDEVLSQACGRSLTVTGLRSDGSVFGMGLDLRDVQLGARTVYIACMRDISERQAHNDTLEYRALHDDLTDLPNRVLFRDRLGQEIRTAVRAGRPLSVLLLDLDGFKEINDRFDHHHGDVLLRLVARRLTECLRDSDTVARLGGDEFAILPGGRTDLVGAASLAWKIEQALEPGFLVEGHVVDVRASIGIALLPDHGDNVHDLLRRADLAMYDAKRSGGGYAVFAVEQEEAPARRLALLGDLRHCVAREELVLHYQPKIDLATRETIGVEALVRWNHPVRGLLMPGDFMPEVENNDLMISITDWVISESLRTLRGWRDQGFDLTMAVNLGARCLGAGTGLFETVDQLTETWGIPPDKVTFELTESALLDTTVPGLLERLQDMDERLSIDDFGTGYSSLVYLQRLPVVEIKADRSFVSSLASVEDDAVIVRAIIDLAHNLGVTVVAEGVEDERTMELLVEYGCDAAQGYFFSRPLPQEELLRWLVDSPFGQSRGAAAIVPAVPALI